MLQSYEPELFSRALPCLAAIGCALSPDCAVTGNTDDLPSASDNKSYVPTPVEIKKVGGLSAIGLQAILGYGLRKS